MREGFRWSIRDFLRAFTTAEAEAVHQVDSQKRAQIVAEEVLGSKYIVDMTPNCTIYGAELFSVTQLRHELAALVDDNGLFGEFEEKDPIEDMDINGVADYLDSKAPKLSSLLKALMVPQSSRPSRPMRGPITGKSVLITSILCNSHARNSSNCLQRKIGIYLHSMGVKRRVISTLAGFGVCETYKTINEENHQIAARAKESPHPSASTLAPAD